MPAFMTEDVARSIYKVRQPQVQGQPPVPPKTYSPEILPVLFFNNRVGRMRKKGLSKTGSVLVVGCGFGGLVQALKSWGVTDVWGLDPGPWIWDNIDELQPNMEIRSRMGNDWVGSGTESATLADMGAPSQFTFVIDEDAAPAHFGSEIPTFISALEELVQGPKKNIIHVVTPLRIEDGPGDSSQNWKTLEDWRSFAPDHTWMSVSGDD